jgi:sphingolipid delta-4 desaturase
MTVNKVMAVLCNIPMGFPSALSFGKHHADHHNYLGEQNKDPDLPTVLESRLSRHPLFKVFFWSWLSLFYAFRHMLCYNRKISLDEVVNYIVIIIFDYFVFKYWGGGALLYLLISAFLSIGPHPAAIHVLAEHFEFVAGLETYDYFGVWNVMNLNLGYHIEHHDFPTCPWYNLPEVRRIGI